VLLQQLTGLVMRGLVGMAAFAARKEEVAGGGLRA
jgi:hypothetical protein